MPGSSQEPGRELLKSCLGALLASRGALRSHPWVLWPLGRQGAIGLCPGWPHTGLSSLLVLNGPGSTRGMRGGGQSAGCPPWPERGPGTQIPPPPPALSRGRDLKYLLFTGVERGIVMVLWRAIKALCAAEGDKGSWGRKGQRGDPPPKELELLCPVTDGTCRHREMGFSSPGPDPQHHESRREFGSPPSRSRGSAPHSARGRKAEGHL